MKKTFIRRVISVMIALMMVITSDITAISGEVSSEGVKSSSPETTTERGGFPDGTGEPSGTTASSEMTAPARIPVVSVTEPSAETAAPAEASETDETEETRQDEIALMSLEEETHTHSGVEDEFISCASGSLPTKTGSYYLSDDVNDGWTVPGDTSINLCLNGHTINGKITVSEGATLKIYDEAEGKGTIIVSGSTVIDNKGNVTIYGGNIKGSDGKGLDNGEGTLTIKGGTIETIYNTSQITVSGGNIEELNLQSFKGVK